MISELFTLGVILAGIVAAINPRVGLYLLIAIGCLQDPVRKLTPGAPPIMAISGLPVWLGLCLGTVRRDPRIWERFRNAHPRLARLLRVFLVCLVPPVLLVFSYGLGAWPAALLGSFSYVAPLATMVVAFSYVYDDAGLRRLLAVYSVFAALMLVGTLLEQQGSSWQAVGTEALGAVWMRFPGNGAEPFRLLSGFFRSPDIMGWHAAMLVMATMSLVASSRRARDRAWLVATAWGVFSLVVAGRRKMLVMPVVWLAFMLLTYLRAGRLRAMAALLLVVIVAVGGFWFASDEVSIQSDYYAYARVTFADAPQRFSQGTLAALWETFIQSGVLGRGIGSATQGAQHVVGGAGQSWQESGASKLLVELGLPGFICSMLILLAVIRSCRAVLARVSLDLPQGVLLAGMMAMLVANAASFSVSHQVYGDLLTATLTSFFLGVVLSGPRWGRIDTRQPAKAPRPPVPSSAA